MALWRSITLHSAQFFPSSFRSLGKICGLIDMTFLFPNTFIISKFAEKDVKWWAVRAHCRVHCTDMISWTWSWPRVRGSPGSQFIRMLISAGSRNLIKITRSCPGSLQVSAAAGLKQIQNPTAWTKILPEFGLGAILLAPLESAWLILVIVCQPNGEE